MIIILIIILTLIILILYYCKIDNYISGFWLISDQFKEQSGLDQFVLYISPDMTNGYIILNFDNKNIYNDNITFKLTKNYILINEDVENLPKKLYVSLDKNKGKLTLTNESKIYGIFYKDNQMSELTIIENN